MDGEYLAPFLEVHECGFVGLVIFFFFNDTATTEIYTLSLHDALPILCLVHLSPACSSANPRSSPSTRSEEHTSELQSRQYLVCRLLLEKKKNQKKPSLVKLKKKKKKKKKKNYKII